VTEGKHVDRSELVHIFQISKGKCVGFPGEELRKLETSASREIVQFLPIADVDPVYFVLPICSQTRSGSAKALSVAAYCDVNQQKGSATFALSFCRAALHDACL
jgi:non-homologous end joining protein Ku